MTNQPIWKYAGHIGDVDPIAYGGGFVYTDETNVYGPELTYFEPGPDEEWHDKGGETKLTVYRVLLESGSCEWWYSKLSEVAEFTGQDIADLERIATSPISPLELASLYSDLIHYFGPHDFDSYPTETTENEAYAKYAEEMKQSR